MTNKILCKFILGTVAIAFLTGCNSKGIDSDLVGSESCSPPCWKGIIPVKTEKNQAVKILRHTEEENAGNLTVLSDSISWQGVDGRNFTIDMAEGLVIQIRFYAQQTSLEEVIDKFGEPEGFVVVPGRHSEYSIILYYPSDGLAFFAVDNRWWNFDSEVTLYPSMQITYAYFMAPTDMPGMMTNVHGEKAVADVLLSECHEWHGYGVIEPKLK